MTPRLSIVLLAGSALAFVAACDAENSLHWDQPAGAFIDEGGFGNATMRNTLAMKCTNKPKGYIVPDPVVVLDPDHPKSPQPGMSSGYRNGHVRCSGDLNGKYAKVIFDEYVESATELPPSEDGGLVEIAGAAGG